MAHRAHPDYARSSPYRPFRRCTCRATLAESAAGCVASTHGRGGLQMYGAPSIAPYTHLTEVGRGGLGTVYQATEGRFGRKVAVKVIRDAGVGRDVVARFERECLALGSLSDTRTSSPCMTRASPMRATSTW